MGHRYVGIVSVPMDMICVCACLCTYTYIYKMLFDIFGEIDNNPGRCHAKRHQSGFVAAIMHPHSNFR